MNVCTILIGLLALVFETRAVTVPISQGSGRTFIVGSSLLDEIREHNSDSSDNSYDDPLRSASENATLTTASIISQFINSDGNHMTDLGSVRNPGLVAGELEAASKFLRHEADGRDESDGSGDLGKVLDYFVVVRTLGDWVARPRLKSGEPDVVVTDVILHPWLGVDEGREEMSVGITVVQNWTDKRLGFWWLVRGHRKFGYITLKSDEYIADVWVPDNVFHSEKRSTRGVGNLYVTPYGDVSREIRMSVTVNCPLQSENYPFDSPVCSLDFSSFAWSADEVTYKWETGNYTRSLPVLESNGFRVKSARRLERVFPGDRAGLVMEFQLERSNLVALILSVYMPFGCFCLVGIGGLVKGFGGRVGITLSYLMFGLMNVFLGISVGGQRWGYGRTRVDSYYMLCIFTVLATGFVNILRLKFSCKSESHESYEMNSEDQPKNETRLWRDSEDFMDDDGDDEGGGVRSATEYRCFERLKVAMRRVLTRLGSACLRINDFCVCVVGGLFLCWNLYYWTVLG